jgi:hypothetical protein
MLAMVARVFFGLALALAPWPLRRATCSAGAREVILLPRSAPRGLMVDASSVLHRLSVGQLSSGDSIEHSPPMPAFAGGGRSGGSVGAILRSRHVFAQRRRTSIGSDPGRERSTLQSDMFLRSRCAPESALSRTYRTSRTPYASAKRSVAALQRTQSWSNRSRDSGLNW